MGKLNEYYIYAKFNIYHVYILRENRSFVGNHEEVQHRRQPYQSHQNPYDKAISAFLFNSSIGDWFRTTAGVRQGYLLSPTLFNVFLERIMADALENHEGAFGIEGRKITDLRFADDIDGLAGEEEDLANLADC